MSLEQYASQMLNNAHHKETRYEDEHVHQVYNKIASHFSSTRYKPWPVVDTFLRTRPRGSIGLDIGCGNGKYLAVNRDVFIIASDRSAELLQFATRYPPHSAVVADTLSLPHPKNHFDFAISIAVIHHLSSRERRQEAVRCILQTLNRGSIPVSSSLQGEEKDEIETVNEEDVSVRVQPEPLEQGRRKDTRTSAAAGQVGQAGQALIFVWALEQKNSRRGWDTGDEQDVLVPWVLKNNTNTNTSTKGRKQIYPTTTTAIASPDPPPTNTDKNTDNPSKHDHADNDAASPSTSPSKSTSTTTYHRYYHLYKQGELEEDVLAAGGAVVESGYDRDNWWVVCSLR